MIVSKEPPDPVSDHRVEEILEEVELEVTEVQKLAKNYDFGENFNYFNEKVNVQRLISCFLSEYSSLSAKERQIDAG